jgi:hypothetical protein
VKAVEIALRPGTTSEKLSPEERTLARKVTITVLPSAEHPNYINAEDALLQIADALNLLRGGNDDVEWKLITASKNSPFTATAEAVPAHGAPDGAIASAVLASDEFYQGLTDIQSGDAPNVDIDMQPLRKLLLRNTNGIGLTKIQFDDGRDFDITPTFASFALDVIRPKEVVTAPRRVRGSLEGVLVDAGHHKRRPALKLVERTKNRIMWCVIPNELQAQFARETSLQDIWHNSRVRLRGWIEYSRSGKISGMVAETITHVKPREVRDEEWLDRDFTGGLDAKTYLDKLQEGDLG